MFELLFSSIARIASPLTTGITEAVNFAKFTGKHLCQSLFLIKLQARGPFYRTSPVAASGITFKSCSSMMFASSEFCSFVALVIALVIIWD